MSYINAILFNKLIEDGALCDIEFLLKKSFAGNLVVNSRVGANNTVAESFVVALAGTASKDTYLTNATVTLQPGSGGSEGYLAKNTLLTGQVSKTVSAVSTAEVWTTTTTHGFLVGDMVEVNGVTTGFPDINVPTILIVSSVPTTTTFKVFGFAVTTAHTNGTAIKRYSGSGETIFDRFKTAVGGGSGNDSGFADTNMHTFNGAIGQKINATESFLIVCVNRGTPEGLSGAGSIQGIIVNTGDDPTL